tara:strand:+ start:189 stop:746 length:558 start_codon:yes stop_codon:yes gene_type:complete
MNWPKETPLLSEEQLESMSMLELYKRGRSIPNASIEVMNQLLKAMRRKDKIEEDMEKIYKKPLRTPGGNSFDEKMAVLSSFKHRGRVFLTEKESANFLGIHLGTLMKHRKMGKGPKVYKKKGVLRSQPKRTVNMYKVPDLVAWLQAYKLRPIVRTFRRLANDMERTLDKLSQYGIDDAEFFGEEL